MNQEKKSVIICGAGGHARVVADSLLKSKRNIIICCVIDNLLKGAATQAIQNLNISCNLNNLTGIKYD